MQNRETKNLIADPTFTQKVQLIMQDPATSQNIFQGNPEFKKAMQFLFPDAPQTQTLVLKK